MKGITMAKVFECERDGVVIRGADDDALVANVERHLAEAHPDLFGKVARADILAAASDGLTLRLTRVLPFSRGAVYSALSDPEQLARWWGPHGFTAPSVEFDPREGGAYRIAMQPPDGDRFHLSGRFLEVDPPAHLAYTFRWDPADPDDRPTVVTLSLQERNEGTEILLIQGEFATEQRLVLHEQGWADSFERLGHVLVETRAVGESVGGMASANVDLVLSIYAAWERGDYGSTEWAHPDIDWVRADGPDPGSWTGVAGHATAWRDFLSAWEDYRIEVEDYRELDRERVLVLTKRNGRGKTSGLDVGREAVRGATVWHLRDGKVTRQVTYWDRDRALADLGLTSETGASPS
jgi:uncharacterized protein YndB with AHSA1/START domain/ketosteroid isomerase-like protein